jgi:glycosyltransferase involved in cell wall biosynthesis
MESEQIIAPGLEIPGIIGGYPSVTFALFAYNHERYIREAVKGALAQDFGPIEIILSDDGSTDRTFEFMQDAVANYNGPHLVRLNRNRENIGLASHVNRIFREAKGEVIVVAAGDDISLPSRVSDTVAALRACPGSTMVSFVDQSIDDVGTVLASPEPIASTTTFGLSEFLAHGSSAQREMQISGASRAILKSTVNTFGDLLPDCPAEDSPYLLRSLYVGKGVVCHWPGIRYRQHSEQLSSERSIAGMDAAAFKRQYLLDLGVALREDMLGGRLPRRVIRWVKDRDLALQLRRFAFGGERLSLAMVVAAFSSNSLTAREKAGLAMRYLGESQLVLQVRRMFLRWRP